MSIWKKHTIVENERDVKTAWKENDVKMIKFKWRFENIEEFTLNIHFYF